MTWVRSASDKSITVRCTRERLRALVNDVTGCGRLMPGVESLERVAEAADGTDTRGVYHYRLATVSNGAVTFTPEYEARFDTSDPDAITWEPHGEHNFRSWGTFHIEDGAAEGEQRLRIETRTEASVDVAPVVVVLIEPFAQKETDEVTEGFLEAVREAVEQERAGVS
ncbi:hypothetical protein [Streptomyces iconiensis]|uniref:Polyketide cyclase / dehydrase and lipid transport n=1 Tax=Streptomyces iconiensis TaxID=1384038 RepID=A0ABT6ZYV8_9ACTN|nr:hypothetical protein [Streptomyces iconiensis]MDJ1133989.1 hypothetical protein [Streptomyces iconiensis]